MVSVFKCDIVEVCATLENKPKMAYSHDAFIRDTRDRLERDKRETRERLERD